MATWYGDFSNLEEIQKHFSQTQIEKDVKAEWVFVIPGIFMVKTSKNGEPQKTLYVTTEKKSQGILYTVIKL